MQTVLVKFSPLISLISACVIFCSECLDLNLQEADSKPNGLRINQGKGIMDIIIPISDKTIEMVWEFQKRLKTKKVYVPEWAKASDAYASNFWEGGTDLIFIQELLGHKSSRSTEIYTYVSNETIKDSKFPLDDL